MGKHCLCCGAIIPEEQQVCSICEETTVGKAINKREQKEQNAPLTLEELSQIKGEPVWVSGYGWNIAYGVTDFFAPIRLIVGRRDTISLEGYGEHIVAYRHKPEEEV